MLFLNNILQYSASVANVSQTLEIQSLVHRLALRRKNSGHFSPPTNF